MFKLEPQADNTEAVSPVISAYANRLSELMPPDPQSRRQELEDAVNQVFDKLKDSKLVLEDERQRVLKLADFTFKSAVTILQTKGMTDLSYQKIKNSKTANLFAEQAYDIVLRVKNDEKLNYHLLPGLSYTLRDCADVLSYTLENTNPSSSDYLITASSLAELVYYSQNWQESIDIVKELV